MRIAVFGAGGLGGYVAATLARGGANVTLIARGERLAAVNERGLTLRGPAGDFTVRLPATDRPGSVGAVDVVLFLVKTYDTETAASAARPLVGDATSVVSFQNGVDAAERLAAGLRRGHVLGGVAYIVSAEEAPGTIARGSGAARFILGALASRDAERAPALASKLREAGLDASASPRIEAEIWEKFAFICAFSGLTGLCRQPIGPLRDSPETRALYVRALEEAVAIARAKGVPLSDEPVARAVKLTDGLEPSATSSLQRDLEAGRPLEIDALSGRVASYGRELGVPTPVHEMVYAALLPSHRLALARRGPAADPVGRRG